MSNSAINTQVAQLKIGNVQNQADNSAVYSGGIWSLKNSTALTSVTIDNSGNVGIGTDSPTSLGSNIVVLDIKGKAVDRSGGIRLATSNDSQAGVMYMAAGVLFCGTTSSNPVAFQTNGTERGRISADGVWTLGASSGESDNRRHTVFGYTLTSDMDIFTAQNRATSTTADATYAIRCVKGSATNSTAQRFIAFTNSSGSIGNGQINGNGSGAAAFGSYSDRRLKENIVPLSGELQKVLALNPVEFDYKDGSGHQFGFIAQEIEEVYPDAVSVLGETEEMKTVTGWDKTTARLVKAIQELSAKVDAQAAEIEALKAK